MAMVAQQPVLRVSKAYNVAIGTTSTASTHGIAIGVVAIRVMASIDSWVTVSSNAPIAAVADNSWFISGRSVEYFQVNQGDKLAVICDDGVSAGVLNIAEMTR